MRPIAVIDIGSNSVRLVVYEGLNRSPTPLYNEKTLCGLGEGLAETGLLAEASIERALETLQRYRALSDQLHCETVLVFATAATRDASNGADFVAEASRICGVPVEVISGEQEAHLTALGVVSGFRAPDGLVGDLGGGSLELVELSDGVVTSLQSFPIGALRLRDRSGGDLKKARDIVASTLDAIELPKLNGRPFYAIGGTWRAFAKLHMATIDYPLRVLHAYRIKSKHAIALARQMQRSEVDHLTGPAAFSNQRGALLPYGAIVLEEVLKRTKARSMLISALGVREGLLFSHLDEETKAEDPLLSATKEFAVLRSRSPDHARELCGWTDQLFAALGNHEDAEHKRIRHAACWLADIGWRAHADYRGEQSLNIVANAGFIGIDHPGRAVLALTVYYCNASLSDAEPGPGLRHLVDLNGVQRAAVLGAALKLAYRLSASMPGILARTRFEVDDGVLRLNLAPELASLKSDRIEARLHRLAKLLGFQADTVVAGTG